MSKRFEYINSETPKSYVCSSCGVSGCKLWREYQTCDPQLLCCICAGRVDKKDVSTVDAEGLRKSEYGSRTDQIGWYVPAIPVEEEEESYWGYTSVPPDGVTWWKNLPTFSKEKVNE